MFEQWVEEVRALVERALSPFGIVVTLDNPPGGHRPHYMPRAKRLVCVLKVANQASPLFGVKLVFPTDLEEIELRDAGYRDRVHERIAVGVMSRMVSKFCQQPIAPTVDWRPVEAMPEDFYA